MNVCDVEENVFVEMLRFIYTGKTSWQTFFANVLAKRPFVLFPASDPDFINRGKVGDGSKKTSK